MKFKMIYNNNYTNQTIEKEYDFDICEMKERLGLASNRSLRLIIDNIYTCNVNKEYMRKLKVSSLLG